MLQTWEISREELQAEKAYSRNSHQIPSLPASIKKSEFRIKFIYHALNDTFKQGVTLTLFPTVSSWRNQLPMVWMGVLFTG